MNKKIAVLAVLISAPLFAVEVDIPNWAALFKPLHTSLEGVDETFKADAKIYEGYANSIDGLIQGFDDRREALKDAFACVADKFKKLNNDFTNCGKETDALIAQFNKEKQKLVGELEALKISTQEQIDELKSNKMAAEKALADLIVIYDQVVGSQGAEAEKILSTFQAIAKEYDVMIENKKRFINRCDNLKERILKYEANVSVEIADAKNIYCD